MTQKQNVEFAKLELQFLEKVNQDDTSEQVRLMILIFYWIQKQVAAAVFAAVGSFELTVASPVSLTESQKSEFGFMQIAMIQAAGKNDTNEMAQVELVMRVWVDDQISNAVNKAIQPLMKNAMKVIPISKN